MGDWGIRVAVPSLATVAMSWQSGEKATSVRAEEQMCHLDTRLPWGFRGFRGVRVQGSGGIRGGQGFRVQGLTLGTRGFTTRTPEPSLTAGRAVSPPLSRFWDWGGKFGESGEK